MMGIAYGSTHPTKAMKVSGECECEGLDRMRQTLSQRFSRAARRDTPEPEADA